MNGTFFYIGLGLGLAVACGLRPYLPALLAGALSSSNALGVEFGASGHAYHFLQEGWWLLAVTVALVGIYLLQLRLGSERFEALAGGAVGARPSPSARCCSPGPSPPTATPPGPA